MNGTTYTIDPIIAGIMLIRREANMEDWSNPKAANTASKPKLKG